MPVRGTFRQRLHMWWVIAVDELRMAVSPRARRERRALDGMLNSTQLIGPRRLFDIDED